MSFKIVLVEPEIPQNTGNIGRLSLASNCELHLVKPYGFSINDTKVKRAGLDYWKHVQLFEYESWDAFKTKYESTNFVFFSSHGSKKHFDVQYKKDMFLIFGKESSGLSKEITSSFQEQLYRIPINKQHVRSLNIANAVSIAVYEGLRQLSV